MRRVTPALGPIARQKRVVLTASAVVAASLGVYAATAARFPWWGDSAEFVTVARTLGIAHPPGYPLYSLLSALAVRVPVGSPFLRLSLLSALLASLASGVAALTVWVITGFGDPSPRPPTPTAARVAASLLGGLSLAFSRTFWSQATVPEVYSLSALLVLAVVLLTIVWLRGRPGSAVQPVPIEDGLPAFLRGDRPIYLIGFTLGLALAHHLTAVLVLPPVVFALYRDRARRPSLRVTLSALGLLALGLTVYAYLPLRAAQDPAVMWSRVDSFPLFIRHVTGAQYAPRLFAAPPAAVARKLALFIRSLPNELPWFVLVLSGVGLWSLWRHARTVAVVVAAEAVLVLGHALSYRILDIESYYIPLYAMMGIAAGPGLVEAVRWVRRAPLRSARLPVALAVALAIAAPAVLLTVNWGARDLSRYCGAARYLDRMLEVIEPGGIVIALNDRTVFLLWYAHFVEDRRTDIGIVDFFSLAPHVRKWYPGIRLPTREELSAETEAFRVAGDRPADLEWTPVVSYLPLLISLNAGSSPIYADAAVSARRVPMQSFPRGLLAEVAGQQVAPIPQFVIRANDAMWREFLDGLSDPCEKRPETVERYAKTLADQARLRLERGEVEDAVPLLEVAGRLAPDVPHIRNNLGAAYERAGRVDEAMAEYRRAIDLDPGSATSYRNAYVVQRNRGDFERARDFLRMAWRLDRQNVGDLLDLAVLDEQLGEPAEAEALYRKAERLEPDSWEVEIAYADFLSRTGRHAEAIALYRRAESHGPKSPRLLRGLSRCYWMLEQPSPAIQAARWAVELDPADATASYDLAVMLVRTGRADEAVEHIDRALRVDPHLWNARALLAGILSDRGRIEEARRHFERALEDGAGGTDFWNVWLNMEKSLGDSAAVRTLLDKMARARHHGG